MGASARDGNGRGGLAEGYFEETAGGIGGVRDIFVEGVGVGAGGGGGEEGGGDPGRDYFLEAGHELVGVGSKSFFRCGVGWTWGGFGKGFLFASSWNRASLIWALNVRFSGLRKLSSFKENRSVGERVQRSFYARFQ